MQYKAVKIHVYDKNLMKSVINEVSTYVKENMNKSNFFLIQRGWVYGPHLKIICGTQNENNLPSVINDVKEFLEVKKIEWSNRNHIKVDYLNHEKVLEKIALLERYKGDYLPLEPDLKVMEDNYEINHTEMKEDIIYLKEEQIKSEFIVTSSNYYYNLNSDNKTIFLLKLFTILGDFTSSINQNVEAAITESYLSFKSHVEGFKGQLNYHSESMKKRVLDILQNHNSVEEDFINNYFKKFLNASREKFSQYDENDKDILIYFQDLLFELDDMYIKALDNNKINFSNEHSLTNFLEESTDHISDFHKDIMELVDLEFYNSKEFLLGRLLTNWFYTLLPLFSVSPLQKNKLCNLLCLGLEKAEGKTYIDFIHKFNNTIEGGIRK